MDNIISDLNPCCALEAAMYLMQEPTNVLQNLHWDMTYCLSMFPSNLKLVSVLDICRNVASSFSTYIIYFKSLI